MLPANNNSGESREQQHGGSPMSFRNAPDTTPLLGEVRQQQQQPRDTVEDNDTGGDTVSSREEPGHREAPVQYPHRYQKWLTLLLSPIMEEHGTVASVATGMTVLIVCGAVLGFLSPKSSTLHGHIYPTLSACIGYTYFIMWSVSFYPQVLSNFRRQTTLGLSVDFAGLNVLGFACYSVYTCSLYYSKTIQDQYQQRHHGERPTVQSNDVAFCLHALVLSSITLFQIGYYGGFRTTSSQPRMSPVIGSVMVCMLSIVVLYPVIAVWLFRWSNTLDYLYLLSYMKIAVTLIKYIPQVILNFRRKSTAGWSIWQILLDFSGGVLSDAQLVLDCWNMGDFSGITGNLAKFFLGSVSIVFDIMFMLQHYVLYPHYRRSISNLSTSVPVLETDENEPIFEAITQDERDIENLTV